MNIDWGKAPEGATHKVLDGCWYRVEGDSVQFFNGYGKWSARSSISDYSNCWGDLIARPPQWSGEGLPPVGVMCEFRSKSEDCVTWRKAEVMYLTRDTIVLRFDETFAECAGYPDIFLFRPIRTPEQIAADKRLHEIRNALTAIHAGDKKFPNDIVRGNIVAATIEAMIDAGYRKFEIVEEDV